MDGCVDVRGTLTLATSSLPGLQTSVAGAGANISRGMGSAAAELLERSWWEWSWSGSGSGVELA